MHMPVFRIIEKKMAVEDDFESSKGILSLL
jgi:hypothetical protein